MDHPVPLSRDSAMRMADHAEGEQLRKVKEDKKRKKQRKLWAWEQGEDTGNDDDDDDGDDDKVIEGEEMVADNIEWDNLENEDALIGHQFILAGIRTLPAPWRGWHVRGADGERPYHRPTPGANRGERLFRCAPTAKGMSPST